MSEVAAEQVWSPGPAWLFCPADRPDRYVKALAAADVVILDLEDAVAAAGKTAAREALSRLAADGALELDRTVLRINAAGTDDHELDLAALAGLDQAGLGRAGSGLRVMLAKAEDPAAVAGLGHDVVVLLETPLGIEAAGDLARVPNTVAVMWGADDLVAGLGGTSSRYPDGRYRDVPRYARSRALIAAKAHGRYALDAVFMNLADPDGLAAECTDAAAVGFDATVAIHPKQLDVIRKAYRPNDAQLEWARGVLAAAGQAGAQAGQQGVTTYDGRMVDGPIYAQAERILRRAGARAEQR